MALMFFVDSRTGHCLLADSVTERALPLESFGSEEDAEGFVLWVKQVHGKDVRSFNAESLDFLHTAWLALDKCPDCRRVLDEGRCEACDPGLDNAVNK